jgi:hypothetical protein
MKHGGINGSTCWEIKSHAHVSVTKKNDISPSVPIQSRCSHHKAAGSLKKFDMQENIEIWDMHDVASPQSSKIRSECSYLIL